MTKFNHDQPSIAILACYNQAGHIFLHLPTVTTARAALAVGSVRPGSSRAQVKLAAEETQLVIEKVEGFLALGGHSVATIVEEWLMNGQRWLYDGFIWLNKLAKDGG